MHSRHDKRMRLLETHAVATQRRTLSGLVALWAAGKLSVREFTDEELARVLAAVQEDAWPDLSQLSDAELNAIIDG